VNCPKCGTDNPSESKFCKECGSSLILHCSNCDAELSADAKFCHECGTKVEAQSGDSHFDRLREHIPEELLTKLEAASKSGGMAGERRTVTMLFCDVEGSTAAAEQLDPEDWAEIMNGGFEHLITPVYRYEGTVARLMGDAILAFFGAPIAHEDDPERAVLAGLDIIEAAKPYREHVRREHGIEFNVRVGINTGLVVVGEVGSDLHVEYTALGDAVNLAARMEQTAESNTIQITDNTQRVIAPLFDFEPLGGISVKGKAEPVESYRVLGVKAERGALRGIEGLHSPLVGRDSEFRLLRNVVEELGSGRGQLVSVMADAGLGKSRLTAELFESLVAEGHVKPPPADEPGPIAWNECRAFSYDVTTPYAPFADLFSRGLGIRAGDDPATRYQKIVDTVSRALPDDVETTVPYLAHLVGVEGTAEDAEMIRYLQPPQLRERVFDAVFRMVEGVARHQPLVLVFDDVHWFDSNSIELLEDLMAVTDVAPVLMLALFRPSPQDMSWRFHEKASRDFHHRYTQIQLRPLDEDQSRDLVRNLLHVEGLPKSMRELILAKSEGNPFYVEEVIRSLLDAGVVVRDGEDFRAMTEIEDIAVPDTLAAVLTTRLDRLDDKSRLVAQTAAVIGREFSLETLNAIHEGDEDVSRQLSELMRRELVREKGRVGDRTYLFKHALTRETAYNSVLLKRRRRLHLAAGEYLEETESDLVHDLARHFSEAGEKARALPYLVAAGGAALGAYSMPEAISFFRKALDAHDEDSDAALVKHSYEGLFGAQMFSADIEGALETLDRMTDEAIVRDNVPMQVSALNKKGMVLALRVGKLEEGEELLAQSKHLAEAEGDHTGLAEFHVAYCYVNTNEGRLDKAKEHQLESTRIGEEAESAFDHVFGLAHYADTLLYLTDFEALPAAIDEARSAAESLGEQQFLGLMTGHTMALYQAVIGNLDDGLKLAEEGLAITSNIGAAVEGATVAFTGGYIASLMGRYEKAIELYDQGIANARYAGLDYLVATCHAALALIHHAIGGNDEEMVAEMLDVANEALAQPLGVATSSQTWADMAMCALDMGDLDTASMSVGKGLEAQSALTHLVKPWLLAIAALVEAEQTNLDRASELVAEANEYSIEVGLKVAQPFVAYAAGRVAALAGDVEAAARSFEAAAEGAADLGQLPLLARVHRAAADLGREGAAEHAAAASRAVDAIAATFEDGELRAKYLSTASG
jgi:class 3 adenylate cyclase/tetratricopeptide (TPR) repeat protein/ribosomal protein L40E